ncbi:MAG: hypothetical protein FWD54_01695 [Endomicrobia bacterium]|nr:hypothetical protein [Endomicrobiia bacterium]MCL2798984.1 hypothetical protein [Endomicrobiia bacterium]
MRLLKLFILSIFLSCFISCGVSYNKEKLIEQLEALVKKECDSDSKASIFGKTLYLDMELDALTSKNQDQAVEAVKKMQNAVISITRVVLSSDSEIQFMVVSVFDKNKNVLFRIIQNIEDIKAYFYMRISKGDYESRSLMEIEGPEYAKAMIEDKHDITLEEYVGRMIVSQIDMASRSNPFFGALISMIRLRYEGYEDSALILSTAAEIDDKTESLIKGMVAEEVKKYSEKYNVDFKTFRIINLKDNSTSLNTNPHL